MAVIWVNAAFLAFPVMLFGAAAIFLLLRKKKVPLLASLTTIAFFLCAVFVMLGLSLRIEDSSAFKIIAWVLMVITGGLLLACLLWAVWKFFGWLGEADPAGGSVNPDERRRIVAMVEQNKMTSHEGAELLDALGKSSALRGQQTFSRLDILILLGIAATIMGFFLPWKWQNMYDGATGKRLFLNGYQVGVVGGVVLGCSIIAAILVFITPKDHLYKLLLMQVMWICLGMALAGSIWIGAGGNVAYGVMICVCGFGVAMGGSMMKLRVLGK